MLYKKKGSTHDQVDSEGSWAISYGDMITLLLTFFVIYFSTDLNKPLKSASDTTLSSALKNFKQEAIKLSENEWVPREHENFEEKFDVKFSQVEEDMMVTFTGLSFFDSGKVEVREEAKPILSEFYSKMNPYLKNYSLVIRAFTDNKPVNSETLRFKDNLELSALRSVGVMRVLSEKGIPLEKMTLSGDGPMSKSLQELVGILNSDENLMNSLSRTIMIVFKKNPKQK